MNPLTLTAPQDGRRTRFAAFFLGFSLVALYFVAVAFDRTSGISESWLYCGSFIVVGAGISAILFMRYRFRFALCAGISFLPGILVLHYCDVTPVKPFRRLDAAVQDGMTLADVRSEMQREFPDHGRFPDPVLFESVPASGIGQMVLLSDRRFGFSIFVSFRDGRVSDKQSDLTPISDMTLPKIMPFVAASVCFMCWQSARRISGVKPWIGHGIDVGSVAERLQGVRRDYLRGYRTRHNVACQRRGLLASTGLAIRRFPYFRSRATGSSPKPDDEREKA